MLIFPIELEAIVIPLVFITLSIFLIKKFKLEGKSSAYKVVLCNAFGYVFLLEMSIVVLIVFNSELISTLIIYPPSVFTISMVFYYTVKTITTKENIIEGQSKSLLEVLKSGADASINVSNIATELSTSAYEVNSAVEEIATTTQSVSRQAQNQVKSLLKVQEKMRDIKNQTNNIIEFSKHIEEIIRLLTDISGQTNLLALNASIEAGRAGIGGRGFSVVAEQVRKLSEESKNSINNTAEQVSKILELITSTGKLINDIFLEIDISTKGEKKTASAMEFISASTEEQTSSMQEISATAIKLEGLAEELKRNLNRNNSFKN
ncbi:MAG: methyl-accepting chemotaxis protein [Promethearchaeota archaeon]